MPVYSEQYKEQLVRKLMPPSNQSVAQVSRDSRISDIVNGARPISADTALRLGLFFSMDPRYWLNLQSEYDMRTVMRNSHDKIAPRIRGFQPAAATLAG